MLLLILILFIIRGIVVLLGITLEMEFLPAIVFCGTFFLTAVIIKNILRQTVKETFTENKDDSEPEPFLDIDFGGDACFAIFLYCIAIIYFMYVLLTKTEVGVVPFEVLRIPFLIVGATEIYMFFSSYLHMKKGFFKTIELVLYEEAWLLHKGIIGIGIIIGLIALLDLWIVGAIFLALAVFSGGGFND